MITRIVGTSALMTLALLVAVPTLGGLRYFATWALFASAAWLLTDTPGGTR